MKQIIRHKSAISIVLFCIMILTTACQSTQMLSYYSEKGNYISATGIITYVSDNEKLSSLYISFSELTPSFDDICFKICGNNYQIVIERGIKDIIQVGDYVEFVTAPKYFGDGYIMPIVSLTVDGQTLLEVNEGIPNLLKWLESQ